MHIARRVMNVDPLVSFEGAVKCGVQFTEMGGGRGGGKAIHHQFKFN